MSPQISRSQDASASAESEVRELYQHLIESWNRRDADAFAVLFQEDGECIGFDGSQMSGPAEIAATLQLIFLNHQTAPYVAMASGSSPFFKIRRLSFMAARSWSSR